ncbi:E3 ubiquitin/ISG15 ligase TRIM25-like [Periophthalmus magnuspinnatus]|uniref:E3 ubiquitin/ISG15 ligase TRIM25-like n=1 Tax=Periophthalmus magnuspinnatus TaxID=409849 RepID=UPI00145A4C8F|nr:E3 ubiquitin/ISG15 ligase TRIM25-like [Periophthalmus magnuspinnatus]
MSSTSERSSEETFLCSICLEMFSEPVTTPCGHNFCRHCISQAWDTDGRCTCPLCKRSYSTRPELSVNTLLKEMVSQFKLEKEKSKSQVSKPGEVKCDLCSEPKLEALKSCLVCLSSFCESHLQPHLTVSGLKKHQLTEPVENLEDKMCPIHQRPLELFCDTDEKSVCMMCSVLEHKDHKFLSLQEACDRRRSSMLQTQSQSLDMVKLRKQKIQEILKLSETAFLKEKTAGLQAFTALMQCVQRHKDLFLKKLEEKQSGNERRAQDLVKQLEKEIHDLEQSCSEAKRLSHYNDPLHFLQGPAPTIPAGLKNWSSVRFEPETCEGSVTRALLELENSLSEEFKQIRTPEWSRVKQCPVEDNIVRSKVLALTKQNPPIPPCLSPKPPRVSPPSSRKLPPALPFQVSPPSSRKLPPAPPFQVSPPSSRKPAPATPPHRSLGRSPKPPDFKK